MSSSICFICDRDLSEGEVAVVKERGVKTLLESSKQRRKSDHQRFLISCTTVSVHNSCKKHYCNPKLIAAYQNRGYKEADAPFTVPDRSARSKMDNFNFKDQCFLCGEVLSEEFQLRHNKKPNDERFYIHKVTKLQVKERIKTSASTLASRGDEWGQKIVDRLSRAQSDLVAVDAWYHRTCHKKLSHLVRKDRPGPSSSGTDKAMEIIYSYLQENSDECQFLLTDLLNLLEEEHRPQRRTLKNRLLNHYGEDLIIVERSNKPAVICFTNVGGKILTNAFYENRKSNIQEERERIVKAAGKIILEDIRSVVYDTEKYPPDDNFLSDVQSVIPATLQKFLEVVIMTHKKGDLAKWRKKVVSLSHAIIAATRPASFLTSLLIGTSTYLYKKFGSKLLINLVSALGFCATYTETLRFEASCVLRPKPSKFLETSFCQFVFDNADSNINTLDGLNTFHSMGGIMCVAPHSSMLPEEPMKRISSCSSADIVGQSSGVQLLQCKMKDGLRNIVVRDVDTTPEIVPSVTDLLWLYGKHLDHPGHPGWNGFMEETTAKKDN